MIVEPAGVPINEIARQPVPVQEILLCRARVLPIAARDGWRLDSEPAHLVGSDRAAVLTEQLHIDPLERSADAAVVAIGLRRVHVAQDAECKLRRSEIVDVQRARQPAGASNARAVADQTSDVRS